MKFFLNHRAVFNFRIDVDHFYPKHALKVLEVAEKFEKKMTWFITADKAEKFSELVKRISQTQDVQSHAFTHKVFSDKKQNFENIKKADAYFKSIGISVCGFAAPFGEWNEGIGENLEKLNYLYTSEFSVGSKIFPFFPVINNKKSKLLQVPVHGVSLGNLLDRGYSPKKAVIYFEKIIDFFYENKIPIFLYGHPERRLGKYPEVLTKIFEKINSKEDIFETTLTDYARNWIKKGFIAPKNEWQDHNIFLEDYSSLFTTFHRKLDLKLFYLIEKLGL